MVEADVEVGFHDLPVATVGGGGGGVDEGDADGQGRVGDDADVDVLVAELVEDAALAAVEPEGRHVGPGRLDR